MEPYASRTSNVQRRYLLRHDPDFITSNIANETLPFGHVTLQTAALRVPTNSYHIICTMIPVTVIARSIRRAQIRESSRFLPTNCRHMASWTPLSNKVDGKPHVISWVYGGSGSKTSSEMTGPYHCRQPAVSETPTESPEGPSSWLLYRTHRNCFSHSRAHRPSRSFPF